MKKIAVTVALFVLSPVAVALAGSGSTVAGYGGSAGVQSTVQKSGSLPFTGMDLSIVAAIALVLVASGLLLRRANRQ